MSVLLLHAGGYVSQAIHNHKLSHRIRSSLLAMAPRNDEKKYFYLFIKTILTFIK